MCTSKLPPSVCPRSLSWSWPLCRPWSRHGGLGVDIVLGLVEFVSIALKAAAGCLGLGLVQVAEVAGALTKVAGALAKVAGALALVLGFGLGVAATGALAPVAVTKVAGAPALVLGSALVWESPPPSPVP